MKILVLNCGSSSIKYKLFDMPANIVLAQGGIEKIGMKDSFLKITLPNQTTSGKDYATGRLMINISVNAEQIL